MAFLSSFDICASGLSAQRLRMDIASENVSNIDTTRTEAGGAYRRKLVVFESYGTILSRRRCAMQPGETESSVGESACGWQIL